MTSIDYEGDIDRITAILKHAANGLYPSVSAGDGLLRNVLFGEDSKKIHDGTFPYALVTTPDRPFFTKDSLGVGENSSDPQHSVQYLIRVFTREGRPQVAEKLLYGFIKKVTDILKANPRLKEPVGLTDPKCIRSFVDIPRLEKRGEEIQSVEITLTCQIGEIIELVYDGTTISVLEEVNGPHGWNTTNSSDDTGLIDVAPVFLEEKKFFKIETNPTLQATLRGKIRSIGYKAATITTNGTARAITFSMLIRISDIVSYDQISQTIIELDIIKDNS